MSPAGTAQITPDFTVVADSLLYNVRVDNTVQDELNFAITPSASDTVLFYTVAGCSGAQAPTVGPTFDAGTTAWYPRIDDSFRQ